MADVDMKMRGKGESPAKCCEAVRRRVEMRRFAAATAGDPPPPRRSEKRLEAEEGTGAGGGKRSRKMGEADLSVPAPPLPFSSATTTSSSSGEFMGIASTSGEALVVDTPVAFGFVSLTGRSREMEDTISVHPGFFRPLDGGSPMHFFAVFDGHGGSHVSALCQEQMHVLLAEELATAAASQPPVVATEAEKEQGWRSAMAKCFARMDELALSSCACGRVGPPSCACERAGIESEIVGSTAVVAVLSPGRLLVANCGDSRAVLSRAGRAFPLSADHKPDRPDELARIEEAGGRVIYLNGARVHGILAMSRALGDKYLKPVVISEPEVRVVERTAEDECLIIASDGLWDVLSNDLACDVARRCLEEADPTRGAEEIGSPGTKAAASDQEHEQASEPRCSLAAALLARLALGRKSTDNISVIVIDLRRR